MATPLDIVGRLHARLLDVVRTGLPLLAGASADADLVGLGFLREEMVDLLGQYRRHAARAYATAIEDGDNQGVRACERLAASCAVLDGAYEEFRQRWAHRDTAGQWHEYRLSAIRMMKLVRDHVEALARPDGGGAGRVTAPAS